MTARLLDAIVVEPVDALVDQREHLPTGALLPPPGADGPGPHPAEETLRGRVARRTALRARQSRQPEPLHEFRPSRPPMVTAVVGTHQRTRALGQRDGRLLQHGVGEPRVGAVSGRADDYLAVVAADHRREIHLPSAALTSAMSVSRFSLGRSAVKSRAIRLPGAGVVSPS